MNAITFKVKTSENGTQILEKTVKYKKVTFSLFSKETKNFWTETFEFELDYASENIEYQKEGYKDNNIKVVNVEKETKTKVYKYNLKRVYYSYEKYKKSMGYDEYDVNRECADFVE